MDQHSTGQAAEAFRRSLLQMDQQRSQQGTQQRSQGIEFMESHLPYAPGMGSEASVNTDTSFQTQVPLSDQVNAESTSKSKLKASAQSFTPILTPSLMNSRNYAAPPAPPGIMSPNAGESFQNLHLQRLVSPYGPQLNDPSPFLPHRQMQPQPVQSTHQYEQLQMSQRAGSHQVPNLGGPYAHMGHLSNTNTPSLADVAHRGSLQGSQNPILGGAAVADMTSMYPHLIHPQPNRYLNQIGQIAAAATPNPPSMYPQMSHQQMNQPNQHSFPQNNQTFDQGFGGVELYDPFSGALLPRQHRGQFNRVGGNSHQHSNSLSRTDNRSNQSGNFQQQTGHPSGGMNNPLQLGSSQQQAGHFGAVGSRSNPRQLTGAADLNLDFRFPSLAQKQASHFREGGRGFDPRQLTRAADLNLNFRFPSPDELLDSHLPPVQRQMGEEGSDTGSKGHARHKSSSTHGFHIDPNQMVSNEVVKGHSRHNTAVKVPTDVSGVPNAAEPSGLEPFPPLQVPTTPRSVHKRHSKVSHIDEAGLYNYHAPSVSMDEPEFRMSGGSTPRQQRRLTMTSHAAHGPPPPFALQSLMEESDDQVFPAGDPSPIQSPQPDAIPIIVVNTPNEVNTPSDDSVTLKNLKSRFTQEGVPTLDDAMKFLPLSNQLESCGCPNYGVIRITNIPYSVKRSEIYAFLGRAAKIVPEAETEPIHIILDRVDGKTMDVFVEMVSNEEAVTTVGRYKTNRDGGRSGRLGTRHVELEVVGSERLMKELFPRAKHVEWRGYKPVITPADPNSPYDSPFQEFITTEELSMLYKYVEAPQRSQFITEALQRPYESLISTMLKYPWYMTKHIRIKDRDYLWKTVLGAVVILKNAISADIEKESMCLTSDLLKRVCKAVVMCKGFTVAQKYEIHRVAEVDTHGWVPHPEDWIWQALGPKKTIVNENDVLDYYMALINKLETEKLTIGQRRQLEEESTKSPEDRKFNAGVWGPIKIGYPSDYENLTMDEVADLEWEAIYKCLSALDKNSDTLLLT